jgi:ATP-dependent Lon protease
MTTYPAIISRELIALPSTENLITAGRPLTVAMVKRYIADKKNNKKFVLLTQNDADIEEPKIADVCNICTVCEFTSVKQTKSGVYEITFNSIKRAVLSKLCLAKDYEGKESFFDSATKANESNFYVASVDVFKEISPKNDKLKPAFDEMVVLFKKILKDKKPSEEREMDKLMTVNSTTFTVDQIITFLTAHDYIKYKSLRKQILMEPDLAKRIKTTTELIKERLDDTIHRKDKETLDMEINQKVNDKMSKSQREFYLREKMKTLKDEIGKINPNESDVGSYKQRLDENPYPQAIKERVLAEINRMESNSYSPESGASKQYIE